MTSEKKPTLCDRNCNEFQYAECPGNDGPCIMQPVTMDVEVVINNGIRIVARLPKTMPPTNPNGTLMITGEILDVLEPPEARAKWLEYLASRSQSTST